MTTSFNRPMTDEEYISAQKGFAGADGSTTAAVASGLGALLGTVGVALLQNAQKNKELKTQKQIADEQIAAQKEVALQQAKQPVTINQGSSHTGLYIAITVGAVLLVSTVTYAIVKRRRKA